MNEQATFWTLFDCKTQLNVEMEGTNQHQPAVEEEEEEDYEEEGHNQQPQHEGR